MKNLMMTPMTGVKNVKGSEPMTKRAYCEYRGWNVPEGEDPNEMVILVEYPPEEGQKPNHPNHEGYISMSPLGVFEKAYKMPHINIVLPDFDLAPFQLRVVEEAEALKEKITALDVFINGNSVFLNLGKNQQDVMKSQLSAMVYYFTCLSERICDFKALPLDLKSNRKYLKIGEVAAAWEDGKCLARSIWDGTDKKFTYKQVPAAIGSDVVPNMISLPKGAVELFVESFEDKSEQIDAIYFANQLVIVGLSNTIDSYSPSVQDIFAEDWYIVE